MSFLNTIIQGAPLTFLHSLVMFHVYTPHQEKLPVSEDMPTVEEIEYEIEENNEFLRVARTKRRIDDFTRCAVRLEKQLLLAKRRAPVT